MPGPSLEESLRGLSKPDSESVPTRPGGFPWPPRTHWAALVLSFVVLSFADSWLRRAGLGARSAHLPEMAVLLWTLRQASFVSKLKPGTSLVFTTGCAALIGLAAAGLSIADPLDREGAAGLLGFIATVMVWIDLYRMRRILEYHYNTIEPYGLLLINLWLFLFGPFYLQYHLRRIALWKDRQVTGQPPAATMV